MRGPGSGAGRRTAPKDVPAPALELVNVFPCVSENKNKNNKGVFAGVRTLKI